MSAYRGDTPQWSLPVAAARSVVSRRVLALIAGAAVFGIGAVVGQRFADYVRDVIEQARESAA